MGKFLQRLQKIKQIFIQFRLDKRQKALEEWKIEYPYEYDAWVIAGSPAIFIYKTRR